MIIYKTTNHINDKFYIGQHNGNNPLYLGSGKVLKRAIKKYGKENFTRETLEECSSDIINEREEYWIDKTHAVELGYNQTWCARGGSLRTKTIKKKISEKLLGVPKSETHKRNMSMVRIGKPLSDKHKMALRGPKSDDHKRKLGLAKMGCSGSKSNGAKLWKITNIETGEISYHKGLTEYCKKEGICYGCAKESKRFGKPYKGYTFNVINYLPENLNLVSLSVDG